MKKISGEFNFADKFGKKIQNLNLIIIQYFEEINKKNQSTVKEHSFFCVFVLHYKNFAVSYKRKNLR